MKYKIINSDILLNGQLIPQNSEVELSAEETKGIEDYLQKSLSGEASSEAKTDHPEQSYSVLSRSMYEDPSTNNEQKIKTKRGNK